MEQESHTAAANIEGSTLPTQEVDKEVDNSSFTEVMYSGCLQEDWFILLQTAQLVPYTDEPIRALENPAAYMPESAIIDGQGVLAVAEAATNASVSQTKASRSAPKSKDSSRVLPTVGAYAVQCVKCFKWRLIPSKEQYEAIRHCAIEEPWVCSKASSWRPNVSCDDPADLSQDMTRLWIIDKPNIPRPPSGWERLLAIRGEGACRFADVYYMAPSGKKLRSMVEVEKFLEENPQYVKEGVNISQFNYQIPRPLHDGYVRKRSASEVQNQANTGRSNKSRISSQEEN
eukprot:Gb_11861 [translate_table: standard]